MTIKQASTTHLKNAINQQAGAAQTAVSPYRKAEAYLKKMEPAIMQALPKNSGMSPERFACIPAAPNAWQRSRSASDDGRASPAAPGVVNDVEAIPNSPVGRDDCARAVAAREPERLRKPRRVRKEFIVP
jgi:hypothetical protein